MQQSSRNPVASPPTSKPLTLKERAVVQALCDGYTASKQIAARLGMSDRTARTHLFSIYKKMGVHSKTEVVLKVMRERL